MRDIDVRELMGAYATDTLLPVEARRLHEAALEDQELFNALADEDLLREALADEAYRGRLKRQLRALNERSGFGFAAGFADWFKRPAVVSATAVAAIALAVGIRLLLDVQLPREVDVSFDPSATASEAKGLRSVKEPASPETASDAPLERLWDRARIAGYSGISLGLDRAGEVPRYTAGERMRIGFSVTRDAVALLLVKSPGGDVRQLFPDARRSSPLVRARERVLVPRAGQGYRQVAGRPGRHRLRLLVFSASADPLKAGLDERAQPIAAERQYQVVGP